MLPAVIPAVIPVVYAAIAGLGSWLLINTFAKPGIVPGTVVPPDFANSPAAAKAVPPGVSPVGLPVITQAQFTTLTQAEQDSITQSALKGILTFTGTQGTLFSQFADDPATAAGGTFTQESLNGPPGTSPLAGLKIMVDAKLAKSKGLDLSPVTNGATLFQCTGQAGETHVPAISTDPRLPGMTASIPIFAITGAGDI